MQIKIVQDAAARFLKDNATTVLTAGGVVGTVVTSVVAFRAGFKSAEIISDEAIEPKNDGSGEVVYTPLSKTEKVKLVWPHVVPPVIFGGITIGSIIMAHRMSAAKIAALAAAYGVSQKQLDEYKAKLEEKLGIQKTEKAKAEMAQERANNAPGPGAIVIFGDEVLCFDEPTGRYFKSTMEKINQAANTTNREIMNHGYAPASMFYSELEVLPGTTWSDDVGWNQPFELETKAILVDGKPCIAIDFRHMPILDYVRGSDRYS